MANVRKNLVGMVFGRLTVKIRDENHGKKVAYICICECGNEVSVQSHKLLIGNTKSCGCLRSDAARKRGVVAGASSPHYTHGYAAKGAVHPLWYKWSSIKARCYNKNVSSFVFYGARGIAVCKEWLESSKAFIEWGINNGWAPYLQIDRIDNEKGYSPDNCRFVTQKENARNRRSNRLLGDKTLAQISEETGVCCATVRYRIENGKSLAEASKNEDYRRVDSRKS